MTNTSTSLGTILVLILSQKPLRNSLCFISLSMLALSISLWPNSIGHSLVLKNESQQKTADAIILQIDRFANDRVNIHYQYTDHEDQMHQANTATNNRYLSPTIQAGGVLSIVYHNRWPQFSRISWLKEGEIIRFNGLFWLALVVFMWSGKAFISAIRAFNFANHLLQKGLLAPANITQTDQLFSWPVKSRYHVNFTDSMGVLHKDEYDCPYHLQSPTELLYDPINPRKRMLLAMIEGHPFKQGDRWQIKKEWKMIGFTVAWLLLSILALGLFWHQL